MIVPKSFDGHISNLKALSPSEIKDILNRNFYWASTIMYIPTEKTSLHGRLAHP